MDLKKRCAQDRMFTKLPVERDIPHGFRHGALRVPAVPGCVPDCAVVLSILCTS